MTWQRLCGNCRGRSQRRPGTSATLPASCSPGTRPAGTWRCGRRTRWPLVGGPELFPDRYAAADPMGLIQPSIVTFLVTWQVR
jgi:hypothetical protein